VTELEQARQGFHGDSLRPDGAVCPCCDRYGKRHRRKLNSGIASSLLWLVRTYHERACNWIDIPRTGPRRVVKSREPDKWAQWEPALAETRPYSYGDETRRGMWRPTEAGIDFVHGRITVPSHGIFYNTRRGVVVFEETQISIQEALGDTFDYGELMAESAEGLYAILSRDDE